MVDEIAPSFYTKEGRITEPAPAEEIAHLADPAEVREINLRKESEGELTAEQKKNIEIRDGVEQKYPNTFKVIQDEAGKVLWGIIPGGGSIIFGKEGAFRIYGSTMPEGLDAKGIDEKKLAKMVNNPKSEKYEGIYNWMKRHEDSISESRHFKKAYLLKEGVRPEHNEYFSLARLNLTTEDGQKEVRESLIKAEELGKERKETETIVQVPVEKILAGL